MGYKVQDERRKRLKKLIQDSIAEIQVATKSLRKEKEDFEDKEDILKKQQEFQNFTPEERVTLEFKKLASEAASILLIIRKLMLSKCTI